MNADKDQVLERRKMAASSSNSPFPSTPINPGDQAHRRLAIAPRLDPGTRSVAIEVPITVVEVEQRAFSPSYHPSPRRGGLCFKHRPVGSEATPRQILLTTPASFQDIAGPQFSGFNCSRASGPSAVDFPTA